jgi:DNA polymerase-3 subunit gamma/tau
VAEQAPSAAPRAAQTDATPVDRTAPPAPEATEWNRIVPMLGLRGIAQQLALHSVLLGREGDLWRLQLANSHAQMRTGAVEDKLRAALEAYTGETVRLSFQIGATSAATPAHEQAKQQAARRQEAMEILNRDPNVQGLRETFNARITPDSVKAVDD